MKIIGNGKNDIIFLSIPLYDIIYPDDQTAMYHVHEKDKRIMYESFHNL